MACPVPQAFPPSASASVWPPRARNRGASVSVCSVRVLYPHDPEFRAGSSLRALLRAFFTLQRLLGMFPVRTYFLPPFSSSGASESPDSVLECGPASVPAVCGRVCAAAAVGCTASKGAAGTEKRNLSLGGRHPTALHRWLASASPQQQTQPCPQPPLPGARGRFHLNVTSLCCYA